MLNVYAAIATLTSFVEGRLNRDEKGATAVEYGLLVALIAAVIIATVVTLGDQIQEAFQTVVDELPAATT
ncbi:Flp family type IVb pilin [Blastococcus saxobsidens]|uniref:Pilus subunit protein PilA n=1 Tax=Blastococcus saxobsidens (strain DD2) TaxID=1146883 RepID=H6RRT7_BLASD|nr:Flp family type IVb pilin [Blastococcus saxobsidens]CCG02931.1 Pilus subunit protein PilA [Blastococcus saxobsidens DD2]